MIRNLLGRSAEEPDTRSQNPSGDSSSLWAGFAMALHAVHTAADRALAGYDGSEDLEGIEGIGLAAWDAQVRHEIAHHRQRARQVEQIWHEDTVLEQLAVLTSRYTDNGPWRAAAALFGPASDSGRARIGEAFRKMPRRAAARQTEDSW